MDRLSQEMARFEQEMLGVAATAPPKPTLKPTPLIPPQQSSYAYTQHPTPPIHIPIPNPSTSIPPLIPPSQGSGMGSDAGASSMMDKAAEAVTMHKSMKSSKLKNKPMKDLRKLRKCGDQVWEDPSLEEWDPNGYRVFCGDLGNDVNDDTLTKIFCRYPSFQKAKVIRDKWTKKTKGYGFVSFKDPHDYMQAMKEMNGKYVGSRPIRLKKSTWKDRRFLDVKKREKEKKKLGLK